jgi:Raf kinase inhibitor-like YbhB/YbcL family protein
MLKEFYIATTSVDQNGLLEGDCAFCDMSVEGYGKGKNLSPHLLWGNAPEGTKTFALLCVDIDVPTDFTYANKAGVFIEATQERKNFIHWMVGNIPQNINELPKGFMNRDSISTDLTSLNLNHNDLVLGLTDYNSRFGNKAIGYWGPCGPTNDLRLHRYIFKIYALSTERLSLEPGYNYDDFKVEVEKSLIATTNVTGLYSRNINYNSFI